MNNSELMHTGRLGMKWGQHIFGGKSGSSSSGRSSTVSERRQEEANKRLAKSENRPIGATRRPKSMQEMTNAELQAYNTRKQLEATYLSYQPKARVSKGKQFTQTVMTKVVAPVAIDLGKSYLKQLGTKAMKMPAQSDKK